MAEDIEGLSNTIPLRAQEGGPLHLLKQAAARPVHVSTPSTFATARPEGSMGEYG